MRIFLLALALLFLGACTESPTQEAGPETPPSTEVVAEADPPIEYDFPEPIGPVSDYAELLTPAQNDSLVDLLTQFQVETGMPLRIVIVDSCAPYPDFASYSSALYEAWDGDYISWINNGALIAVCHSCAEVQIRTGRKTDITLTEDRCQQVIDRQIVPYFKEQQYGRGLYAAAEQLISMW